MTTERRGFPVGLTVAVGISLAILVALGTWQLQRLHWKTDLLARIAALQSAEARPLEPVLAAAAKGADVGYTRVKAICPGLAHAPFLQLYGIREGEAGVRLISACRLTGAAYGSILVDRGFSPDTAAARPDVVAADATPIEITGVVRAPDKRNAFAASDRPDLWYTRDIPAMAKALGAPTPAPLFLMAETAVNPEVPTLVPAPVPVDIPNRHLEYALTWFGLAGALLGVYAAMLFKRRKT